jgi:uncharacterized protein DUF1549/uncharacterized protein DUF1553/cytochrome c
VVSEPAAATELLRPETRIMRFGIWISAGIALAWTGLAGMAATSPSPAPAPAAAAAPGAKPDPQAVEFFEKKIRPLLSEQCFACHTGANARGKLDLRSREKIMAGGELGPAIVPGDPDKSLLIQVVRFEGTLKMPPKGKLPAQQIQDLTEWVKMGAPWPVEGRTAQRAPEGERRKETGAPAPNAQRSTLNAQRSHWSLQPVRAPKLPVVKDTQWVRSPIDQFILAGLEKQGLKPSGPADRRTLIRRATFDLTGLPPTPEEVEAFLNDPSPDAWEKVVDRLLASPRYGERWGRHWLDAARYADSNGLDENEIFPNAYRYRDWVIRCFNEDKPYDQFIKEQLAGDLMPGSTEAETYDRLVATGFLVLGPKVLAERDKPKLAMDVVDEQIDTTGKAFLGLTLGCARCHDHKFDPVTAKDYYALAGIFKSTTTLFGNRQGNVAVSGWMERPLAPAPMVEARKAHDAAIKKLQDTLKKTMDAAEKERLTAEIKALDGKAPPEVPMAMAVQEGKIGNVRVHIRGSYKTLGEEVPRRFITVLAGEKQAPIDAARSGRLELANWIAAKENPLTARVMVNRIWQHHFGWGIVRTPDDFGIRGERPTHPELLDWLASYFVAGNEEMGKRGNEKTDISSLPHSPISSPKPWSIKKMHRLIMLSNAYQMSSEHAPASYARDPENRLLWRMNRKRLEAEAIRDAILYANGQLDLTMGGTVMKATGTAVTQDSRTAVEYNSTRRSIYLPAIRTTLYELFQVFDFVDPHVVTGKRATTTVAPQALYLMNSPFMMDQGRSFAELLLGQQEADDAKRLETAYHRAFCRPPTTAEVSRALAYVEAYSLDLEDTENDPAKRRLEAWRSLCQTLIASSEFRHIE